MRPIVQSFSLDIQGFEVHQLETKLSTQDFKDENIVQDLYFRELEVYFKAFLGAKEVRALDSQVCACVEVQVLIIMECID